MARQITATELRKTSEFYKELYADKDLQIYALGKGRFEVKAGSLRKYAHSLSDIATIVDELPLESFPSGSEEVISAIDKKLANTFRLEVYAGRDTTAKIVHVLEGSKEGLSKEVKGVLNVDVSEMEPGKRYACTENLFGGDYLILIPLSTGLLEELSPSLVPNQLWESQKFGKGQTIVGIEPVSGGTFMAYVEEAYPNGSFKARMGDTTRVFSVGDIAAYSFTVQDQAIPEQKEDFHAPDDPMYVSENIPTYNPSQEIMDIVPTLGSLSNYDNIMKQSSDIISEFMKTASKVAYLDKASINKISVSKIDAKGQATDGSIEWNVRISSPYYKRSSIVTFPMEMKEGMLELGKYFVTSTLAKVPLTVEALNEHLGRLADDESFLQAKRASFPSTIKADADIDNLLVGVELPKTSAEDSKEIRDTVQEIIEEDKPLDNIPGGTAEDMKPSEFSIDDLAKGISIEMEHTDNPEIAAEITLDHKAESPVHDEGYYNMLEKKVEKPLEQKAEMLASKKTAVGKKFSPRQIEFLFRWAQWEVNYSASLKEFAEADNSEDIYNSLPEDIKESDGESIKNEIPWSEVETGSIKRGYNVIDAVNMQSGSRCYLLYPESTDTSVAELVLKFFTNKWDPEDYESLTGDKYEEGAESDYEGIQISLDGLLKEYKLVYINPYDRNGYAFDFLGEELYRDGEGTVYMTGAAQDVAEKTKATPKGKGKGVDSKSKGKTPTASLKKESYNFAVNQDLQVGDQVSFGENRTGTVMTLLHVQDVYANEEEFNSYKDMYGNEGLTWAGNEIVSASIMPDGEEAAEEEIFIYELEKLPLGGPDKTAGKGRHETTKSPSDSTFNKEWSGVSNAPHACGKYCPDCGEQLHREGGSYYCPSCDDYKTPREGAKKTSVFPAQWLHQEQEKEKQEKEKKEKGEKTSGKEVLAWDFTKGQDIKVGDSVSYGNNQTGKVVEVARVQDVYANEEDFNATQDMWGNKGLSWEGNEIMTVAIGDAEFSTEKFVYEVQKVGSKKTAADWTKIKDAIMSSETKEQAVQKLNESGYKEEESNESIINRLWDNYKESFDPNKPENKASALIDQSIKEYIEEIPTDVEGEPDFYTGDEGKSWPDRDEIPAEEVEEARAVYILDTLLSGDGDQNFRDRLVGAVREEIDEETLSEDDLLELVNNWDTDLDKELPENIGIETSEGFGDVWLVLYKPVNPTQTDVMKQRESEGQQVIPGIEREKSI
jgi:uncharacterized Zn finger protein (UPF0148 family)